MVQEIEVNLVRIIITSNLAHMHQSKHSYAAVLYQLPKLKITKQPSH